MSAEGLVLEHEDGVTVLRFDRPASRNALSRALLERLPGVCHEEVDRGARALVLTGSSHVFSAGVDLAEVTGTGADIELDTLVSGVAHCFQHLPVPVVAAIEGACVGAAVEIAVACDVRIGGEGCFFLLPAASLGLVYKGQGIRLLTAELGRQTVHRLLVLGGRIPATGAVPAGLLAQVVGEGHAREAATALAAEAASASADAVRLTKELLWALGAGRGAPDGWEQRRRELLDSGEHLDAIAAAKVRLNVGSNDGVDEQTT